MRINIFKRKKTPYPRSFAKRLTRRIVLTLLVTLGLTSYLIYEFAIETTNSQLSRNFQHIVTAMNVHVEGELADVSIAARNNQHEIESQLAHPEKMYEIMERIVRLNPRIRSCGISFIADYYPKQGRWFCPYAVKHDSTTIEVMNAGGKNYDYLNAPWFVEGLQAQEGFWSEPFFDSSEKNVPLISYLLPIHDQQGKTVALLGADLSLDWMSKMMDELSHVLSDHELTSTDTLRSESEYKVLPHSFIVDKKGTFVVHKREDYILKENIIEQAKAANDTLLLHCAEKIVRGEESNVDLDEDEPVMLDGQKYYLFFAPMKTLQWSIVLCLPKMIVWVLGLIFGLIFGFLVTLGLLVTIFVGRLTIRRSVKPLKHLAMSAREVAKGHFDTPLPTIKSRDEIHMLRDSFDEMQHSLTAYVEELKATTTQKASIENELKIAHGIQMAMLPKTFPPYPERTDVDIYGMLTPAKAVGGDLFDFHIRDEKLFFCIGDVSGKGVPASLVMAVTRSLFRNVSAHVDDPNIIVASLNEALAENNETNMFVTVFVGVLNLQTGSLRYCNAGHDAPLLIGRGVGPLPCDSNLPIGVMPDWNFTNQEEQIDPQTTILLFTDGLNEAEDASHAQFGDDRILSLASRLLEEKRNDPRTLIEEMTAAVRLFVGEAEQSDDLTMLAVQYKA